MSVRLQAVLAVSSVLILSSTSFAQSRSDDFYLGHNTTLQAAAGLRTIATVGMSDDYVFGETIIDLTSPHADTDTEGGNSGGGRRSITALQYNHSLPVSTEAGGVIAQDVSEEKDTWGRNEEDNAQETLALKTPKTVQELAKENVVSQETTVVSAPSTPVYSSSLRQQQKAFLHHLEPMVAQANPKLIKTYDPYPLLSGELQRNTLYDVEIANRTLDSIAVVEVMTNDDGFFLVSSPLALPQETYRWRFTNRETQNYKDYWMKIMADPKQKAPSFTFELGTIWQHESMRLQGVAAPNTTIMAYYDRHQFPLKAVSNERGEFTIILPKNLRTGDYFLNVVAAAREYDRYYHLPSHALYRLTVAPIPNVQHLAQNHWEDWDIPPVLYPLANVSLPENKYAAAAEEHTKDTDVESIATEKQNIVWNWIASLFSA